MYPISSQLADQLEIFCEKETIQPESFVKRATIRSIVWFYNHLQTLQEPNDRHRELAYYIATLLRQSHFVPMMGPLQRVRRCFIRRMPPEVIQNIIQFGGFREFSALTTTCKKLFCIGYETLAHSQPLAERYVERHLVVKSVSRVIFQKCSYNTPLDLKFYGLQIESVNILDRFKNIRSLELDSVLSNEALFSLLSYAKSLESLTIKNKFITLRAFSTPLPNLTSLSLSHLSIEDKELAEILSACPRLKFLSLMSCQHIYGQVFQLARIAEINFCGCIRLGNQAFIDLMSRTNSLESINVGHCHSLTDYAFRKANYPQTLRHILAPFCNIDDVSLQKILKLPNLAMVDVSNCFQLTRNALVGVTRIPSQICLEGTNADGALALYLRAEQGRTRSAA